MNHKTLALVATFALVLTALAGRASAQAASDPSSIPCGGCTSCGELLVAPEFALGPTGHAGAYYPLPCTGQSPFWIYDLPIPNNPSFVGLSLYTQFAGLDYTNAVRLSGGVRWVMGTSAAAPSSPRGQNPR